MNVAGIEEQSAAPDRRRRVLFVVSREHPTLFDHFRRSFADVKESLEIVLDRRFGERRRQDTAPAAERRSGDRRRLNIAERLRSPGWAVVRPAGIGERRL